MVSTNSPWLALSPHTISSVCARFCEQFDQSRARPGQLDTVVPFIRGPFPSPSHHTRAPITGKTTTYRTYSSPHAHKWRNTVESMSRCTLCWSCAFQLLFTCSFLVCLLVLFIAVSDSHFHRVVCFSLLMLVFGSLLHFARRSQMWQYFHQRQYWRYPNWGFGIVNRTSRNSHSECARHTRIHGPWIVRGKLQRNGKCLKTWFELLLTSEFKRPSFLKQSVCAVDHEIKVNACVIANLGVSRYPKMKIFFLVVHRSPKYP